MKVRIRKGVGGSQEALLPANCDPFLRNGLLPWLGRQAQHKGMGWVSPTFKEKVLIAWSSICNTNQSSIFLFKCKNKKIIYMGVQIMCAFSKEEKPFWSQGAKLEARILLEIRLLLKGGWGWQCLKSWLLGAIKPSLLFKGFSVLPALLDMGHLTGASSSRRRSPVALVYKDTYAQGFRNMSWLVNLSMYVTDKGVLGYFLGD